MTPWSDEPDDLLARARTVGRARWPDVGRGSIGRVHLPAGRCPRGIGGPDAGRSFAIELVLDLTRSLRRSPILLERDDCLGDP